MKHASQLSDNVQTLLRQRGPDLSMEEDLVLAVMNLVSLEEHAFFTAAKTGKQKYLTLLEEARTLRAELMARMLDHTEGESWCMAKHILAATMRLIEVGTKLQRADRRDLAEMTFRQAYALFGKFWELRLAKEKSGTGSPRVTTESPKEERTVPWTTEKIFEELVDCCNEHEQPASHPSHPSHHQKGE